MKKDKTPRSPPDVGAKPPMLKRRADDSANTSSSIHAEDQNSVSIAPTPAEIQALETTLSDVSVIDAAKVEAVKQAINEGRFKIDAGAVADRLINAAKELLNRRAK